MCVKVYVTGHTGWVVSVCMGLLVRRGTSWHKGVVVIVCSNCCWVAKMHVSLPHAATEARSFWCACVCVCSMGVCLCVCAYVCVLMCVCVHECAVWQYKLLCTFCWCGSVVMLRVSGGLCLLL